MMSRGIPTATRAARRPRLGLLYLLVSISLAAITTVRLTAQYRIFNGTYDEPFHIASGLEWLDKGTYTYELQHPPLARVAVALGPYLKGLRAHSLADGTAEGNAILYSDGEYERNLLLARLGNLPFLIMASAVLFLWARRWFATASGIWALVLFLSLPPILGHAALATLDMACAATLLFALYHLMRWIENPVWWQSFGLGAALSLAFLTKFSTISFLVVCCGAAALYWLIATRGRIDLWRQIQRRIGQASVVALVMFVLLWAGYRFSWRPLSTSVGSHSSVDKRFSGSPLIRTVMHKVLETPIPLGQLVYGLLLVYRHNEEGHDSYLMGEYSKTGWWYFFPVVIGVKTPLGFLILGGAGILAVFLRVRLKQWQRSLTALFPMAILLFCMTSRINLGVRHILAIYPLLALMAGHAIWVLFQKRRWRMLSAMPVLLVCTILADSWLAHPDYLAHFNQLAGDHPETILSESDLDWGQDLRRLSLRLKSLGVERISIGYFGTAPLERAGLPAYRVLTPYEKATGYVAISARNTTLEYAKSGAYGWLRRYTPLERIGKSIFLYRIDE